MPQGKKEYDCQRCGYCWAGRLNRKPKSCPKCRSYSWEKKNGNSK